MRTCKNCKCKFDPQYNKVQQVCSFESSIELAKNKTNKKQIKDWNKEKAKRKEALKTLSDYLKELQVIFNQWVRLRDKGRNCISCKKKCKKENAGHYRSVGGNPELRFEPLNCHLQCEYCNTYLHGNLIDYRINLIHNIGLESVEWLEGRHEPKHYTIDQIKGLKVFYRLKIKNLKDS
jgi:hypothetical protein